VTEWRLREWLGVQTGEKWVTWLVLQKGESPIFFVLSSALDKIGVAGQESPWQ